MFKPMNGAEFCVALEAAAHKLCAGLGLRTVTISWCNSTQTASINSGGDIKLCGVLPDQIIPPALARRYVGFVFHELLHRAYTDFTARGETQYLATLHNAVEDAWIECRAINATMTGNAGPLLGALIDGMVCEALDAVRDWSDPRQYPFALAVWLRPHASVKVPLADGLRPIFDEAARRLPACQSSHDTLAVARWVMEQLQQPPANGGESAQDQPGGKQDAGQADKQDGGDDGEEGEGAGEGAGEEGEDAGDGQGEGQGAPGDGVGGRKVVMQGTTAKSVEPQSPSADGGPKGGNYSHRESGDIVTERGKPRSLACNQGRLRREIRMLLDNSAKEEHDRQRRSGKVNPAALHRAGHDDRLFARRREEAGVDSAVLVMVDISGSMAEQKIDTASAIAAALYAAAKQAGAAVRMGTFDTAIGSLPWDAPAAKVNSKMARVAVGGGTHDYTALRWASTTLAARPEPRKLLVMLTDGNGQQQLCREWARSLDRSGMLVVGVGIGVDLSSIYRHAVTVHNVQEMGGMTFGAVLKALR